MLFFFFNLTFLRGRRQHTHLLDDVPQRSSSAGGRGLPAQHNIWPENLWSMHLGGLPGQSYVAWIGIQSSGRTKHANTEATVEVPNLTWRSIGPNVRRHCHSISTQTWFFFSRKMKRYHSLVVIQQRALLLTHSAIGFKRTVAPCCNILTTVLEDLM